MSFRLEPATLTEELIGELRSRWDDEGCVWINVDPSDKDKSRSATAP
jgi:hypothetical protein